MMMALHARRWLAGVGFRVPGLAVCWLTLPTGLAVLTVFIEELCGMLVHLGPQGPSGSSTARITPAGREALQQWLASPDVEPDVFKSPLLLHLFFGHLMSRQVLIAHLERRQQKLAAELQGYEKREQEVRDSIQAPGSESQLSFLLLTLQFQSNMLQAALQWATETVAQLKRLKDAQIVEILGGGKGRAAYYTVPDKLFGSRLLTVSPMLTADMPFDTYPTPFTGTLTGAKVLNLVSKTSRRRPACGFSTSSLFRRTWRELFRSRSGRGARRRISRHSGRGSALSLAAASTCG
jgi:hypothetical protein